MGTRAKIVFWSDGEVEAQILRTSDGYPSGLGADLLVFLHKQRDERAPNDTRFDCVGTLAARWVHYELTNYAAKHQCQCVIFTNPEDYDDAQYHYHIAWNSTKETLTMSCMDLEKDEETLMFQHVEGGSIQ